MAYYPFNGNANDESGNGNNGTVHGAALTTDRQENPDSAYSFNGQTNHILVPDSATLDLTGNITLAAWVYADSATKYKKVISKGNNYELSRDSSTPPRWRFWVSGGPTLDSHVDMVTGSWVHLAATYDGNYMRIYVNGEENNQVARTGALIPDSSVLYIGDGSGHYFVGKLDEIRIYDRALTASDSIFRPSSGLWAFKGITRAYFGGPNDTPVSGDYDGDGAWRPGIFRSSSGLWALVEVTRAYFGSNIDQAVPGGYNGNGTDSIGIFRSSSGLWAIRGITRVYFGGSGDLPVTR